jgi:hypothetical protein
MHQIWFYVYMSSVIGRLAGITTEMATRSGGREDSFLNRSLDHWPSRLNQTWCVLPAGVSMLESGRYVADW